MWSNASNAGSRNTSAPVPRNQQPTPLSSQAGQDDLFSPPSSRMSQHGSFRFGAQGTSTQQAQPTSVDDFPPLHRNGNGEIGAERMSSLGFGSQAGLTTGPVQSSRGNGLLNALSANGRASDARSPPGIGLPGQYSFALAASSASNLCKDPRGRRMTRAQRRRLWWAMGSGLLTMTHRLPRRRRTERAKRPKVLIFSRECQKPTSGESRACGR